MEFNLTEVFFGLMLNRQRLIEWQQTKSILELDFIQKYRYLQYES